MPMPWLGCCNPTSPIAFALSSHFPFACRQPRAVTTRRLTRFCVPHITPRSQLLHRNRPHGPPPAVRHKPARSPTHLCAVPTGACEALTPSPLCRPPYHRTRTRTRTRRTCVLYRLVSVKSAPAILALRAFARANLGHRAGAGQVQVSGVTTGVSGSRAVRTGGMACSPGMACAPHTVPSVHRRHNQLQAWKESMRFLDAPNSRGQRHKLAHSKYSNKAQRMIPTRRLARHRAATHWLPMNLAPVKSARSRITPDMTLPDCGQSQGHRV